MAVKHVGGAIGSSTTVTPGEKAIFKQRTTGEWHEYVRFWATADQPLLGFALPIAHVATSWKADGQLLATVPAPS